MITYLLQVTICWGLFLGLYHLTLRKETFFMVNRAYLLMTIVLGLAIPRMTWDTSMFMEQPTIEVAIDFMAVSFDQLTSVVTPEVETESMGLLAMIYWLGVMGMLIKLVIGVVKILRMRYQADIVMDGDQAIAYTSVDHAPFTFFGTIYLSGFDSAQPADKPDSAQPAAQPTAELLTSTPLSQQDESINRAAEKALRTERSRSQDAILIHEQAHVSGWHTLDVLFVEIVKAFFWFNPLVYGYDHALKTVHEYIADANVLQRTALQRYGRLLLRQAQPGLEIALANHFYNHQLKKRFNMMTRTPSQKRMLLKYLSVLPFILVVSLVFTNQSVQAEISKVEEIDLEGIFSDPVDHDIDLYTKRMNAIKSKLQESREMINHHFVELCEDFQVAINDIKRKDRKSIPFIESDPGFEPAFSIGYHDDKEKFIAFSYKHDKTGSTIHLNLENSICGEAGDFDDSNSIEIPMPNQRLFSYEHPEYKALIQEIETIFKSFEGSAKETYDAINRPANKLNQLFSELPIGDFTGASIKDGGKLVLIEIPSNNLNWANSENLAFTIVIPDEDPIVIQPKSLVMDPVIVDTIPSTPKTYWVKHITTGAVREVELSGTSGFGEVGDTLVSFDADTFEEEIEVVIPKPSNGTGNKSLQGKLNQTSQSREVFKVVEVKPEFPNGQEAMFQYIFQNLTYPVEARKAGVQGNAVIGFVVEADGSMSNIIMRRDPGTGTGAEALRVIEKMSNEITWTPGQQNGQNVAVLYNIPIRFKLDTEEKNTQIAPPPPPPTQEQMMESINRQINSGEKIYLKNIKTGNIRSKISRPTSASVPEMLMNDTLISYDPAYGESLEVRVLNPEASAEVFKVVDAKPEFPGGQKALYQYIFEQLKYPEIARKNGVEGNAIVGFVIEKDGTMSNITLRRDPGASIGDEALRVVHKIAYNHIWKPGQQDGKSVRVQYNIPIRFKLDKEKSETPKIIKSDNLKIFNMFSPNGDGINDVFSIIGIEAFKDNRVEIFNRWGNLVFEQNNYSKSNEWDGKWNGKDLPEDTYFYSIYDSNENNIASGYVQLTREKENPQTDNKNPLIVIIDSNNKVVYNLTGLDAGLINKEDIKEVYVLKGENATDKYRDQGTNGVVEFYMKSGTVNIPSELNNKESSKKSKMNFASLNIFPNPVSDILTVDIKSIGSQTDLILTSIDGKVLYEEMVIDKENMEFLKSHSAGSVMAGPDFKITHDMGQYPSGVYIVSIIQGDKVYSQPVVKK